jgi:hypothetical protein
MKSEPWRRRSQSGQSGFGPKINSTLGNLDFENRTERNRYPEVRGW